MISVNNLTYPPERRITYLNLHRTGKLMEASMSFQSIKNYGLPRGTKTPRGKGEAKRVFTQSQRDCGTEKELSETRLSLLG